MSGEYFGILGRDRAIFEVINKGMSNSFFDSLLPLFSNFHLWLIPAAIIWAFFFWRTNRYGRLVAIGCFVVVVATDQISDGLIKPAIQRTRPCNVIASARFYDDNGNWLTTDKFGLTTYKPSYSFPSNHASNIAGQATYWSLFYPQLAPLAVTLAALVGLSRVYLGHHYPADVAGGYLLGVILALLIASLLKRWIIPDKYSDT